MANLPSTRSPAWRRLLRGLAIAAILLVLLVPLGVWLGPRILGEERLADLAEGRLRRSLPGEVTLEGLEVSGRRVTLRGVVITDPEGIPVARVDELAATVRLGPLLRRRLELTDVHLGTVELLAEREGLHLRLLDALVAEAQERDPRRGGRPLAVHLEGARIEALTLVDARGATVVPRLAVDLERLDYDAEEGLTFAGLLLRRGTSRAELALRWEAAGEDLHLRELEAELRLELADTALYAALPGWLAERLGPGGLLVASLQLEAAPATPLAARLLVRGSDVEVMGVEVRRLSATLQYGAGVVDVEQVQAELETGTVAGSARLRLAAGAVQVERSRLTLTGVGLAQLVREPWAATMVVEGELRGTTEGRVLTTTGELTVSGLPPPYSRHVPVAWLSGATRLDLEARERLGVDLRIRGDRWRGTLRGLVPLRPDAELDARLTLAAPPGARLPLPAEVRVGQVEAHLRLAGTLAAPRLSGTLTASALRYGTLPPIDVHAPLRLTRSELVLDGVGLSSRAGRAALTGRLRFGAEGAPPSLALEAQGELVLAALGREELAGSATVQAQLVGPLGAPTLTLGLHSEDAVAAGLPLEVLDAQLYWSGPVAQLRADARSRSGAELQLRAARDAQGALEGFIDAEGLPLPALLAAWPDRPPLDGKASIRARLSGSMASPELRGEVTIDEALAYGIEVGRLSVQGSYVEGSVFADGWLSGPVGEARAVLAFEIRRRALQGTVTLAGGSLHLLGERFGVPELAGVVDAEVHFEETRLVSAVARASSLRYAEAPLPHPLELSVRAGVGRYEVSAAMPNTLALVGWVRPSPRAAHFAVNVQEAPLSVLLPRLAAAEVGLEVSGHAFIDYDAGGWSGRARIEQVALDVEGEQLGLEAPAEVTLAGGTLRLEELVLSGPAGLSLRLGGSAGERLDLHVRGTLLLGLLVPLLPVLARAEGSAGADLHLEGPRAAPRLTGRVRILETARVRPRALGSDIVIHQADVTLESLATGVARARGRIEGGVDAGVFTVAGEVELVELRPERFVATLHGRNLPVRMQSLTAELNGDLSLQGDASAMRLAGRVDIARGRYLKAFELREFNFVAREVMTPMVTPPWWERVELDLKISSAAAMDLRVDAGVLTMELVLDADLDVRGTAAQPLLDGRVGVARGGVEFPATRLEVTRGAVEFVARGARFEPRVELHAEGEVTPESRGDTSAQTYFVVLDVIGNLDELTVELRSDPNLERLEVMALLVTGQAGLGALAEGGGEDDVGLDTALLLAGSQLTGPVTRLLERAVQDVLNIRLHLAAEVTSGGLRLIAQQDVTRRLQLEGAYERVLGGGSLTSLRARLLLTDRLFLEGIQRSVTGQGIDPLGLEEESRRLELKWRLYGS